MTHTDTRQQHRLIRLLKEWTLLISIVLGALSFYAFKYIEWLWPIRHGVSTLSHDMMPVLIFTMLLLTFSKVDLRQYCFKKWYLGAIAVQMTLAVILTAVIRHMPGHDLRFAVEGCLICVLTPTATAAAVIVRKLGGQVPTVTTYTLLAGFVTAVSVPLLLPLLPAQDLQMHNGLEFWNLFSVLLGKVFPLLISPFIATIVLRLVWPRLNTLIATKSKDLAFYLWSIALVVNIAQTFHAIDTCHIDFHHVLMIALGSLAACVTLFYTGQRMGQACHDVTSCRQAMGQKNTIVSIWITLTYMSPVTAVAPGTYILWQNIINSIELMKQDRRSQRRNG